eukprot:SM000379S14416  [mRNA]  locus=s379:64075:66864:+ [translate_table: standard]
MPGDVVGRGPRVLVDVVVAEVYKSRLTLLATQWEVQSRESSKTTLTTPAVITSYQPQLKLWLH